MIVSSKPDIRSKKTFVWNQIYNRNSSFIWLIYLYMTVNYLCLFVRFNEFLEFIVNRDIRHDDEEWAPYFMGCSPCQIKFNFIGELVILPGCICCITRAGSTPHWVSRLDSKTECTYSTCCTGFGLVTVYTTQHENLKMPMVAALWIIRGKVSVKIKMPLRLK